MEKKVFRWYGAGAFQANAADLDARSAAGWNLKKPGSCRFTFERGEVRYRYGLDYCPGSFGEEERKARRQRYEAAGWELVGTTLTGWDYWRRPAAGGDDALPSPCGPDQAGTLAAAGRWFWIRAAAVAAGVPPAAVAAVRQQSMLWLAVAYAAVIAGCTLRIAALHRRLPRAGGEAGM